MSDGFESGGKGDGKAKKSGGFLDGLRSFGSAVLDGFLGGDTTRSGESGARPSVQRRDPVATRDRPAAAKQIHRSLKAWRDKSDDQTPPDDDKQATSAEPAANAEPDRAGGDEPGETEAATASPAAAEDKQEETKASEKETESQEQAQGGEKEEEPVEVAAKPISVAAKLRGVHRKIFRAGPKVTDPVPGLYGKLDPLATPPGWQIQDIWPPPDPAQPDLIVVRTNATDPTGKRGFVERGYDKVKKQFVMLNAFLISPGAAKGSGVQNMIEHAEPTMITGKGTPTQTFLTLRQMKLLEQRAGMVLANLEKVKMSTIQNIKGICELAQATKAGEKPDQAIMKNESKRYAETTMVQAGKRIKSAKVVGGTTTPFNVLLNHFERGDAAKKANFDAELQAHGLVRTDSVLWNYDIEFEIEPFGGGTT